ncbi:hypothetical protein [Kitasatospora camelliae]|uniref:Uncharacterized protein n=1 Tax=Kitasatospora camelliae TaxID=3156397 RepID=A0AAU8KAN8_9ACTN
MNSHTQASPPRPENRPSGTRLVPDAVPLDPGAAPQERTWRLVWIRIGGQWRSGILSAWCRPPGSRIWLAQVR